MKKDFVMPIAVLTVICLVVTGALALMNSVTAPVIEAAAAGRAFASMNEKIPHATGFIPLETDSLPRTIRAAYKAENDAGYIFIVSVNGFSGEIRIMAAVDSEGRIIRSSTLQHSETQGIGTVIEEEFFIGRFDGLDSELEGISAVTGATVTTAAYINAIREAFEAFEIIRGG